MTAVIMPCELNLAEARQRSAALASVGRALRKLGFGGRAVCAWYGAGLVSDVRYLPAPSPSERPRRGLGALVALWLAGEELPRQLVPLDDGQLEALAAVGLIAVDGAVAVRARASLVPVEVGGRGVLVAADRLDEQSGEAVGSPDVSAWNLAASLPRALSLLDVGCGAGVASLLAAQGEGARVVGTDIDGRALAFAEVNALLNGVRVELALGDLFAGVTERFAAVAFNAPLVRAPMASGDGDDAPLYLRSPRGEALALEFLDGARARTVEGGEVLCHVQLAPAVAAAVARAPFAQALEIDFAAAADGTPHGLVSLRDGAARYRARVRVPLGPALGHLHREVLDRLHATREALATETLATATLRPPPWLALTRVAQHDGAAFRPRSLRFGTHRLDDADLALLESCNRGAIDPADWPRALTLVERGLLVV